MVSNEATISTLGSPSLLNMLTSAKSFVTITSLRKHLPKINQHLTFCMRYKNAHSNILVNNEATMGTHIDPLLSTDEHQKPAL